MRSMHGIHVHGFPNLFIIGFAQGANLISNVTSNLADSGVTIAAVVRHAVDTSVSEVEVTADAEQAWRDFPEQRAWHCRDITQQLRRRFIDQAHAIAGIDHQDALAQPLHDELRELRHVGEVHFLAPHLRLALAQAPGQRPGAESALASAPDQAPACGGDGAALDPVHLWSLRSGLGGVGQVPSNRSGHAPL